MFDGSVNPLIYPAGRVPTYNTTHIASKALKFSAVATSKINFIDLLTAKIGNPFTSPTYRMDGVLGPCLYFVASSGCQFLNGKDNATYNGRTYASIFRFDTGPANQYLVANSTAGGGAAMAGNASALLSLVGFGSSAVASTGLTMTVNVPYFAAISQDGTNTTHFVLRNLATGVIKSEIVASGNTPTASSSGYNVGCSPSNNGASRAAQATAMYSAEFNPVSTLIKWSENPWGFWYPE